MTVQAGVLRTHADQINAELVKFLAEHETVASKLALTR
jgi:hypothetical protein